MGMASDVRTEVRNDVRMPAITQNCYKMWSHRKCFLCLAVSICKGSSCLLPKKRVLPSPAFLSYTWRFDDCSGDAGQCLCPWLQATEAGEEVLFDHCALSLVLGCRQEHRVF